MSPLEKLWRLDRELKRKMLGMSPLCGCRGGHHSTGDWDFQSVAWRLDTSIYHSPPSSLHGTDATLWAALLATACTLVTQGRIVDWTRTNIDWRANYFFRNQAAVGGADYLNTYQIRFYETHVNLWRIIGGSGNIRDDKNYYAGITFPVNTWVHLRVTWWESETILFVRVEWEDEGVWVKMCDDLQDAANSWGEATSPTINRCGVTYHQGYWHDDTEIWRLVT